MTSPRRQRKRTAYFLSAVLCAGVAAAFSALPLAASTTERVVADLYSGLAIGGFDPVAYFIEGEPKLGLPEYEYRFAGVIWRFRNEGNMAVFAENPDAYMPRYGGYDPMGVARGVAARGNPLIWTVSGQRLFLFYSGEARARFAAEARQIIPTAESKWPAVRDQLAP
jgi:hypothetical protein